jgi:integrase
MCHAGKCRIDCEGFKKWGRRNQLSETSVLTYAGNAKRCDRWLGPVPLWEATTEQLNDYVCTKRSDSHRNSVRTSLVQYWNFRESLGFTGPNVAKAIPRYKLRRSLPKTFPREAMPALLLEAPSFGPMVEALTLVFAYEALRRNEARWLRWRDVHSGYLIVEVGKGGHQRMVPLHDDVAAALKRWKAECPSKEFVFPSPRIPNQPISGQWIYNKMKELGAHIDLVNCRPHRFRHSAITEFYATTGDLLGARDFAGHSSSQTTEIYIALVAGRVNDGVKQLNFRI